MIEVVDPRSAEVAKVLARHHAYVREFTPPEDIHALNVSGLLDPTVTVFGLWTADGLAGIGALKELGDGHGELKSMHTIEEARGRGIAGALVDHLVGVAASRGLVRVSIETGTTAPFAPARALYASRGFTACAVFEPYEPRNHSHFMTRTLKA